LTFAYKNVYYKCKNSSLIDEFDEADSVVISAFP